MFIYCTYITFYRGNRLPPFYIGSSSIKRVHNGYHGTVRSKEYQKIWKDEIKYNPHLFKTIILSKHLTRDEALAKEAKLQKATNAINNKLYANKSIARRGFGNLSEESKKLISIKAKSRDYSYLKGSNHHYWGGRNDLDQTGSKNPNAKKCTLYGESFGSIKDAANHFNIPYKKCWKLINSV